MRISSEDGLYRGSHITGPTHNYLGLRLSENGDPLACEVTVLPAIGDCRHGDALTGREACDWIAQGVAAANGELGTGFSVTYAEIVENDPHRPEVYAELARRIVKAAHEDGLEGRSR